MRKRGTDGPQKPSEEGIPKPEDDPEVTGEEKSDGFLIVGIGASAGGIEALRALLPNLPTGVGIAYVIAQHLDPTHPTMLASLLGRFTSMEVKEIDGNETAEPDKIYITPPGKDVTLSGRTLRLTNPTSTMGPKPSIDYFFTSIAESMGDRAVGIILSGTGSDGAHGIRAIKAGGGITIVQSLETAKYNGMPRSAIETGHVDLVFPPEKIGQELLSLIKFPLRERPIPSDDEPPDDINTVFRMLRERTACDFTDYKLSTINRRIGRRMTLHKVETLQEYVRLLHHSPNELELLFKDILISVTSFFRDLEAFRALSKSVLPKLFQGKRSGDTVRMWVPGCSTGEEAYSLAILVAEYLGQKLNDYTIQIFGTDIDPDCISKARRGLYPDATVVDVDPSIIEKYFVRKDNTVQAVETIREMIVFARQDLIKDPPFSRLDLISCRNVLIYFNPRLQKRVIPLFHYVLNSGGYLFLGKSESIGQFTDLFVTVDKKHKIFKYRNTLKPPLIELGHNRASAPQLEFQKRASQKEVSAKEAICEAIADAYGHSGVLVDDRLEVIYVHGDVSGYLKLHPGDAGLNIINMATPEIRLDLRSLLYKCSRDRVPLRGKSLSLKIDGKEQILSLNVRPVNASHAPSGLIFIAFEHLRREDVVIQQLPAQEGVDPRVRELELELAGNREHLQSTVEELETANEELQSMNEELQSANEELQSSNEELETANEELQSTNEELTTVNEELQVKSAELAAVNADLENILKRIGIPLVIVDKELRVTRFTPAATTIFSLMSGDMGTVITSIGCCVSIPNLREMLMKVIETREGVEQDLKVNRSHFTLRILPYINEHQRPAGAILIFVDNTGMEQVRRERFALGMFSRLVLGTNDPSAMYTKLARIISDHFSYPIVTVELYDSESDTLRMVAGVGLPAVVEKAVPAGDCLSGKVVSSGKPILETEPSERSLSGPLKGLSVETFVGIPIMSGDRVLGVICMADSERRLDSAQVAEPLQIMANFLAREMERQLSH